MISVATSDVLTSDLIFSDKYLMFWRQVDVDLDFVSHISYPLRMKTC